MRNDSWNLTVWGVRGSVPVSAADVTEYGGSTSCVSVAAGDELVVFDAGSGLIQLGRELTSSGGFRRIHILLSHLHIDHLIGLFAFRPLHDPDAEIHLYGGDGEGLTLRERLDGLIRPPYWPLRLDDFSARLTFHQAAAGGRFSLGEAGEVTVMAGVHPNGSLLYRLDSAGRSVTYALDCELVPDIFHPLASFARNTDLLVWDACFAPGDLRPGWGHSSWEQGIALGRACGAGTVLMTHYSWEYSDSFLRQQERLALSADSAVRFAREGMSIQL